MADLIKKIKIKKQDGTFTDYIPIGAEAQNISTNDGDSVQLKINKKPYYYNSIADMKADTKLTAEDMVVTLGYYEPNDGGAGEYKIVNGTYVDDGGSYHKLNNNLYAELIIKEKINIKQFGAYGNGIHDDTSNIQNAINYKHTEKAKTIFFPAGDYCVSHLDMTYDGTESNKYIGITLEGENYRAVENQTCASRLLSIDNTKAIITAGHLGIYNYARMLFGLTIKDLIFDGSTNRATYGLELYLCSNLHLENLMFRNFSVNGVLLEDCYDSLINNCSFGWCGATDNSTAALDLHGNKKTTNAIRITNCRLENNYYSLFLGGKINQIMITNTKFERGSIGTGMDKMIIIGDVMGEIVFTGCVFTNGNTGSHMIKFLPYSSSYHNWRLTNFIGCIFTSFNNGAEGGLFLDLTNAEHVSISSCTFCKPNINNSEHNQYAIILGNRNNLVNNIFEILSGATSDTYYGIIQANDENVITNNHFNSTAHANGPTLVLTGSRNIVKNNRIPWNIGTQQYADWISFTNENNEIDFLRQDIYTQPTTQQYIRANNSKIVNFTTNRTITKTDIINNFSGCELILRAAHTNGLIFTRENDFLPELSSASYTLPINGYIKIVRINGAWHVEDIILPSSIS